ncbi:uncharacterized protein B0I36DRAFT_92437 [Microdochium trichocladiopsis]|uniref:F-box domain-containing protein n=1 Tax=Microdochium trichocladiopsis TaxID=1682393 RepID=A0A9P8YCA8_9PEZI|nr:uncharacterized protein B0I36DRAFT_92437 [Microdochium trichocladiopsis]KAH7035424.1 hypothetical protein B0I36DRAFT_92437 [Microdochium trichocladiopsis]
MTLLTELPPEIIQHVLVHVAPQDLASVPQVCKALSYAVRDNAPLYKAVYLAHLDTPPPEIAPNVQWEQQLKDFVRLQVVCGRKRVNDKKKELPFVYDTVTTLLRNATTKGSRASTSATHPVSRNAQVLASLFADETSQAAFLCRSSIYERARAETIYKSNSNSNIRGSNGGRNNSNGGAATGGSGSDNSNDSKDEIIEQDPRKTDRMRSAKLHCLYGKPVQFAHPESHRTRQSRMRPFACSRVYDLRQYTPQTQWGPFMGGSGTSEEGGDATLKVDWEMVEAIMLVLGANLEKLGLESFPIYKNFWATPFAGVWPNSYMGLPMLADDDDKDENGEKRVQCENCSRPISMPPQALRSQADDDEDSEEEVDANGERKKKRPLDDPYGINGTWLRVVCFLDYNDFFAYNFAQEPHPLPADVPRPAIDVGEATRLILMKIAVTEIEEPGPDDGQDMPVVHFRGISRSLDDTWDDNANSDLAGTVRMTKEGEVRWTTVSIFGGIERWKSESVQVGGVKSSRGVLGNWFDRDYDPRGPVGPTAFWKISDRIAASNHEQRVMLNDFLPIIDVAMDEDYEPITDDEEDEEDEDEDDQEGEDDDDEAMDHSDGDGEEAGDGEMTEADEAAQAAFLASLPEIEIIDGTDIEIIGSQIIWTERD